MDAPFIFMYFTRMGDMCKPGPTAVEAWSVPATSVEWKATVKQLRQREKTTAPARHYYREVKRHLERAYAARLAGDMATLAARAVFRQFPPPPFPPLTLAFWNEVWISDAWKRYYAGIRNGTAYRHRQYRLNGTLTKAEQRRRAREGMQKLRRKRWATDVLENPDLKEPI